MAIKIPIVSDATRRSRQAVPTGRAKKRSNQPATANTAKTRPKTNAPVPVSKRPRAKKPEPTNELALATPTKPKISKTDLDSVRSIIGDKVEHIQQLLSEGNFESATNSMHTVLLQTLVDIIPYAENAIRDSKGQKGVYQINSLASMILETLNSARAQSDRGQLAQHIVTRAVQPAYKLLAESLVREFMTLSADLSTSPKSDTDKILRDTRSRLAETIQRSYQSVSESILKQMAG